MKTATKNATLIDNFLTNITSRVKFDGPQDVSKKEFKQFTKLFDARIETMTAQEKVEYILSLTS